MKMLKFSIVTVFCIFVSIDFVTMKKYFMGRHIIRKINQYDVCAGPFAFFITNANMSTIRMGEPISIYECRGGITHIAYAKIGI